MHAKQKSKRRGAFLIEAAAAVTVLGIITALAMSACLNFAKTQDHYHKRMAALWAAEAQMERYTAGASIDSAPPEGMIANDIALTTEIAPGTGQWEAFDLVIVSARIESRHGTTVTESVRCYLPREAKP